MLKKSGIDLSHMFAMQFLWLSHAMMLPSQIHFSVTIPEACSSTQVSITFFEIA
jgi:hypothetical protein